MEWRDDASVTVSGHRVLTVHPVERELSVHPPLVLSPVWTSLVFNRLVAGATLDPVTALSLQGVVSSLDFWVTSTPWSSSSLRHLFHVLVMLPGEQPRKAATPPTGESFWLALGRERLKPQRPAGPFLLSALVSGKLLHQGFLKGSSDHANGTGPVPSPAVDCLCAGSEARRLSWEPHRCWATPSTEAVGLAFCTHTFDRNF